MRFLLIKSWGYSLWADIEHVIGQLLIAEITNRIPVVYWGMESMYSESLNTNAFELFFEPVSEYTINDVVHPDLTYYPPIWNFNNVMLEDPDRFGWKDRDLKDMMNSTAKVLVSDVYFHVNTIAPWILPGTPYYGMTTHQIYRSLYDKYVKLKPEIRKRATSFIHANPSFRDEKPIVGVHVKGNALVNEGNQLYSNNNFYHPNIWQYFHNYSVRHVFLITDSKHIIQEYRRHYGFNDVLILSDSKPESFRGPVRQCNTDYPYKRKKGAELVMDTLDILKDTYLALECDFFIGNGYSSLSNAVMRLKDWPVTNIKLLY